MNNPNKNCVCTAIEHIHDLQDAVQKPLISCYSNLLTVPSLGDTIPFILFTKDGSLVKAFGNVGDDCFHTFFFRVEHIHDCCVTLRLLLPLDKIGHFVQFQDDDDVCRVDELIRTNNCIEVDLSCFCGIQCLSPRLLRGTNMSLLYTCY
ncbi:CotY/CotZ family spore coat protein [Metabacillus herbersteinensis]|uniref:CotY/CotZ family spore coat protein n=1 Tax=Metabacillus herbersteinensis TaxID=283816 RepID=A0ABV6GET7_9BACI